MKVYKSCCKNCLFSSDALVSKERVKQIIEDCKKNQTYFICHKSKDVCCKSFYDKLGPVSEMIRIAERMNMVEHIEQSESEKLVPYKNRNKKK